MRRLSRRVAVLSGLLLSGVLLLVTRAAWLHASVPDLAGGSTAVAVTGAQAAPLATAAGLVALAASAVTSLTSRTVPFISGPLLMLAGAAAAVSALDVRSDPTGHAASAISGTTGVTGSDAVVTMTGWPLASVAPSVLLILLGAGILLAGRTWPGTARFQRDASTEAPRSDARTEPRDDPSAVWDALSRGEDPTEPPRL